MSAIAATVGSDRGMRVANAALFQAGWFACVLGAAHDMPWIGALAVVVILGWHLALAHDPIRELTLALIAAALGALFETALMRLDLTRFNSGLIAVGAAPYWMVALWAMFATTLNVSARPLRAHPWVAALLGAAAAPSSYYAGSRLGAMTLSHEPVSLLAIAIGWAILTPTLCWCARRFDGYGLA